MVTSIAYEFYFIDQRGSIRDEVILLVKIKILWGKIELYKSTYQSFVISERDKNKSLSE